MCFEPKTHRTVRRNKGTAGYDEQVGQNCCGVQECDRLEAQLLAAQQQATTAAASSSELEFLRVEVATAHAQVRSTTMLHPLDACMQFECISFEAHHAAIDAIQ